MDLTSDAIKAIVDLSPYTQRLEAVEFNGNQYIVNRDGNLQRIYKDHQLTADAMEFNTLTGLLDYCAENKDQWLMDMCQIIINGPNSVCFIGSVDRECEMNRRLLARVQGPGCEFRFGRPHEKRTDIWYDLETFIISLWSQFILDDEVQNIVSYLGHLSNEKVIDNKDNDFSQRLQLQTSITSKSEIVIKNPVTLHPYRTFREIDQPAGKFILRYKNGGDGIVVALFGADGDSWELEAMKTIKEYLTENWSAMVKVPILCS